MQMSPVIFVSQSPSPGLPRQNPALGPLGWRNNSCALLCHFHTLTSLYFFYLDIATEGCTLAWTSSFEP